MMKGMAVRNDLTSQVSEREQMTVFLNGVRMKESGAYWDDEARFNDGNETEEEDEWEDEEFD